MMMQLQPPSRWVLFPGATAVDMPASDMSYTILQRRPPVPDHFSRDPERTREGRDCSVQVGGGKV